MSVNTWYRCIAPERLDQLINETTNDPNAPANYLHPEGFEDEDDDFVASTHSEPGLWTERNWLGLHSLLTFGPWTAQPLLGASIAGGTPIGSEYCYEGEPVRYFSAAEVREIAAALRAVDESALRRTCDPATLNAAQITPIGAWRAGDFPHLWKTFCAIRDFFHTAQSSGYAVLVYLG